MYDAVIIGAGPAGLAAAVYFARQKLSFAIFTGDIGGQTLWSADVEDYLGFHLLDGQELVKKFQTHLQDYQGQFELREGELVEHIEQITKAFRIQTAKGSYESRTVLIATGTKHRELNIPGEKTFYGKGVTYCATCDAPLFKGKNVFVIGGGNSAMDAALFLEKYTDHVSVVTVNAELKGDRLMMGRVLGSKKIWVYPSTKTSKILGDKFVNGIGLVGPNGEERVEPCEGVFIEVGLVPVADVVDFVEKDTWGQIIVDCQNHTSVPGCFAAGDVTTVSQKQISVAVGEGSKAALEMIKYLQTTTV